VERTELLKQVFIEIGTAFRNALTEEEVNTCTAYILEDSSPVFDLLKRRAKALSGVQEEILKLFRTVTNAKEREQTCRKSLPRAEAVRVRKACLTFISSSESTSARKRALFPVIEILSALGTVQYLEGQEKIQENMPSPDAASEETKKKQKTEATTSKLLLLLSKSRKTVPTTVKAHILICLAECTRVFREELGASRLKQITEKAVDLLHEQVEIKSKVSNTRGVDQCFTLMSKVTLFP